MTRIFEYGSDLRLIVTVVSSLKRNKWINFEEHLIRHLESKTLSRSVVQFVHNFLCIFLLQLSKIHSLGEVLAYESVCVLTKPPLPRVVGASEVPVGRKLLCREIIQ